ncbi:MAG: hypothetical protein H5T99_09160, partial [Moorella sp. (in: Bacteria)]|nr:hypothetical protein [Moorella sp. (in: firmicutes)]
MRDRPFVGVTLAYIAGLLLAQFLAGPRWATGLTTAPGPVRAPALLPALVLAVILWTLAYLFWRPP